MNKHCLRAATVLLLGLTLSSMVGAAETSATRPMSFVVEALPAPKPSVTLPAVSVPAAAECCSQCGNCTTCRKAKGTCAARIWDWLTYQPLCTPNKCCKPAPMPCCAPRLYWFFPCVDCNGQCPMGGYTAKNCGCQH